MTKKQIIDSTQPLRNQERLELKNKRIRTILEAGLYLCLEKGVAEVEMKEVAQQAQVGRTTLYRYFPSKRELIYAILQDQATNYISPGYHADRQQFQGDGLKKFELFLKQLFDAFQNFPDFFRLMAMVDAYYGLKDSAENMALLYQQMFPGLLLEDTPAMFLQEGQRDGSVRQDIDPHLYTMSALATLTSLAQHIALIDIEGAKLSYAVSEPSAMIETVIWAMIEAIQT